MGASDFISFSFYLYLFSEELNLSVLLQIFSYHFLLYSFSFSCLLTSSSVSQQVDARIYLWKWNTRIVISDVDGTITK